MRTGFPQARASPAADTSTAWTRVFCFGRTRILKRPRFPSRASRGRPLRAALSITACAGALEDVPEIHDTRPPMNADRPNRTTWVLSCRRTLAAFVQGRAAVPARWRVWLIVDGERDRSNRRGVCPGGVECPYRRSCEDRRRGASCRWVSSIAAASLHGTAHHERTLACAVIRHRTGSSAICSPSTSTRTRRARRPCLAASTRDVASPFGSSLPHSDHRRMPAIHGGSHRLDDSDAAHAEEGPVVLAVT